MHMVSHLLIDSSIMRKHILIGILSILSLSSCVKSLESAGVMRWDLSALDLPQMEYNGKTYYIHPDAGEMTYEEAMRESGRCLRCDHYGCGAMTGGRGE